MFITNNKSLCGYLERLPGHRKGLPTLCSDICLIQIRGADGQAQRSHQQDWGQRSRQGYTRALLDPPCPQKQHPCVDSTARHGDSQSVQPGQAWLGLPLPTHALGYSPDPSSRLRGDTGLQAALLPSPAPPSCPQHPYPPVSGSLHAPFPSHAATHTLFSHPIISASPGRLGSPRLTAETQGPQTLISVPQL